MDADGVVRTKRSLHFGPALGKQLTAPHARTNVLGCVALMHSTASVISAWLRPGLLLCARIGEFSAEQHELRRIVNPDQHDHDRCGGTIGRFEPLLADVESDQELAELEERSGHRR